MHRNCHQPLHHFKWENVNSEFSQLNHGAECCCLSLCRIKVFLQNKRTVKRQRVSGMRVLEVFKF